MIRSQSKYTGRKKQLFNPIFAARSTLPSTLPLTLSAYHVVVKPPLLGISVEAIQNMYGATNFISTLKNFLTQELAAVEEARYSIANARDRFHLYNYICVLSPSASHVSNIKCIHRLTAHPIQPAKDLRGFSTPGHFDTALIIENVALHKLEGGIQGRCFLFLLILLLQVYE